MPDITTPLLPDLIPTAVPISSTAKTTAIHPSRMRNFTNTDTFAAVDPSFSPAKRTFNVPEKNSTDLSIRHPPNPS